MVCLSLSPRHKQGAGAQNSTQQHRVDMAGFEACDGQSFVISAPTQWPVTNYRSRMKRRAMNP